MNESREKAVAKATRDLTGVVRRLEKEIEVDPLDHHKIVIEWGLYRYCMGALVGLMYGGPVDEKKMDALRVRADKVWNVLASKMIGVNFIVQFRREDQAKHYGELQNGAYRGAALHSIPDFPYTGPPEAKAVDAERMKEINQKRKR